MKSPRIVVALASLCLLAAAGCVTDPDDLDPGEASTAVAKGSGQVETITVSKCFTNATATSGGQMLIKASSSDAAVRLFAYRPDGSLIGEVQNGGGSRYGGTVMPYQPYDPVTVTVRSSAGASVSVPTTPFQP